MRSNFYDTDSNRVFAQGPARRNFLRLAAGIALIVPAAAFGQSQPVPRTRRLAVILAAGKTPEYVAALEAFKQALASLGWTPDSGLRFDVRWSGGGKQAAKAAEEIAALGPDVILGQSSAVIGALLKVTPKTPVVFLHVPDPVASGFTSNLAHPDRNVTGVTNIVPTIGGKWLQLLKEIAPQVNRAALLMNPDAQVGRGALYLDPFRAAARSLGITPVDGSVHDLASIQSVMTGLAKAQTAGVVVTPDPYFASHSAEIVALAGRYRLPVVYPYRYYVAEGGLLCYGVNNIELFKQAAPYVDRILRGASPAELPIQQPTRFELVINMKTATALKLSVPPPLLAATSEVIN
jgi:putative ABC transport system substrate-binding protein